MTFPRDVTNTGISRHKNPIMTASQDSHHGRQDDNLATEALRRGQGIHYVPTQIIRCKSQSQIQKDGHIRNCCRNSFRSRICDRDRSLDSTRECRGMTGYRDTRRPHPFKPCNLMFRYAYLIASGAMHPCVCSSGSCIYLFQFCREWWFLGCWGTVDQFLHS